MAGRYINESEIERYLDMSEEDSDFDNFSLNSDEDSEYSPSSGSESNSDDSDMDTAQVAIAPSLLTVAGPSTNSSAAASSNDDGDHWTDTTDPNPLNFSFNEDVGLNMDCSTVEDFVDLFSPQGFLRMLVEQTNMYLLHEKLPNNAKRPRTDGPNLHYLDALPPTEKKEQPTKACRVCTKNKVRRETRYFCPVCDDHPPLCVDCFRIHHDAI